MIYQNLIRDFALRTRHNLEIVREVQKSQPDKVYEVTQLVNSMLGLLVFPQQGYMDKLPRKPLSELQAEGWPLPQVQGHFKQAPNLRQLVRYLRNAITHFDIEFIDDGNYVITGIRVCNHDPDTKIMTWEAILTINELEGITERFINLILEHEKSDN